MKKLSTILLLFSMISICFAFSDNGFNGKKQDTRQVGGIIIIQTLEKSEISKAFNCYISGGVTVGVSQYNFYYDWSVKTISVFPSPFARIVEFPSDGRQASSQIEKKIEIESLEKQPAQAMCYYTY